MMCKTKGNKLGLVLGVLFGLCHLVWVVLVAVGVGQPLVNWFSKMHFVEPVYTVTAFGLGTAVLLVVMAFVVGYVIGWVASWICKCVCKCAEKADKCETC